MGTTSKAGHIPEGAFPILPLRKGVIFPGSVVTLPVGRRRSLKLVRDCEVDDIIGLVGQKEISTEQPSPDDLQRIGTLVQLRRITRRGGYVQLVVEGLQRFSLTEIVDEAPYFMGLGDEVEELHTDTDTAHALMESLYEQFKAIAEDKGLKLPKGTPQEPGVFADQVATLLSLTAEEEQALLEALDVEERLRLVVDFAGEMQARAELKKSIEDEVHKGFSKNQKEALLREQLRAIKKELGEDDNDDLQKLRQKLEDAHLPEEVQEAVDKDLERMEAMTPNHAEYNVLSKYLEWLAALPWDNRAEATEDIQEVSDKLDEDHYGLDDIKKRILEHMAVHQRSGNNRGSILCFAGPPGVGKTSLGRSIAEATNRPFVRIALGGVRDEAEIRGHRRTYIGSLPGRIIAALKKAEVKNPVFLLDEIDKLGRGWAGDPEAALLEVLDPEQNNTFTDHYLEHPFDLSEVMFICTANQLENLSAPLRDRLEIIDLSGYTVFEKLHIAREHLLPKQLEEHGLVEETLQLTDGAIHTIIREYTREAGVRQLNRELQKLCRHVTLAIARNADAKAPSFTIDEAEAKSILGKQKYFDEVAERTTVPGVATGLAWTPTGGDILFIETSQMPGKGRLELTGQLGDVMKESARAALTYIRSQAEHLGVDPEFNEKLDIHIHVPAGAVPKDGPSAGITIFTALTSLLTGRKLRSDTAMTGECTLRGRVLPVGGIKSKVLAAHRAGIRRIILPKRNERDIDDIPQDIRQELTFIIAEDMHTVLDAALEPIQNTHTPATKQQGNIAA